jgi:hypothetical protein
MRLIALLILPSLAFAAQPPEQPEKPGVEVKLSAFNQDVLEITIQNRGTQPLELPYRVSPFEHFVVELHGENGKQYKIEHKGEKVDKAEPGTLTVPAGESKTLSLHTCHFLPALGEGAQKVTFIARLKHDGKTIESKRLTVNPTGDAVEPGSPVVCH